jgi:hypothetical protein
MSCPKCGCEMEYEETGLSYRWYCSACHHETGIKSMY